MSMTPASFMTCFLTKGVMPQLERMDKLHYDEQIVYVTSTHTSRRSRRPCRCDTRQQHIAYRLRRQLMVHVLPHRKCNEHKAL